MVDRSFSQASSDGNLLVYAGRFVDRLPDEVADGSCILSDWDVLPKKVARALEHADALLLMDPLSFPFEALIDDHWNLPITVVLPGEFDARALVTIFGSVLFEHLGPFDYIATSDAALWETLSSRYGWAENQRLPVEANRLGKVLDEVRSLLKAQSAAFEVFGEPQSTLKTAKARHRSQVAVLRPRVAAAKAKGACGTSLDVLGLGPDSLQRISALGLERLRLFGGEAAQAFEEADRVETPGQRIDLRRPEPVLPYEDRSFDLVVSIDFMKRCAATARRALLYEMRRVIRSEGHLLFLEEFVPDQHMAAAFPIVSLTEFVELILDATHGRVAIEHMESLQYPYDDMFRSGLLSFSKLGG